VFPVEVTTGEHKAIQAVRSNTNTDEEGRQFQNTIRKMLVMMIRAGMTLELESDASDAMDATADMSVPMTDVEPSSSLEPEGVEEYGPDDMLYF